MKKYSRGEKNQYSKKDARLPSNYLELFYDTVKQNWQTILLIGLFSFLFFLPSLAMMFWKDYHFLQLTSSSAYDQNEIDALKITSRNIFNIGVCLGIVFSSIGVSGLSRITLLVSREEGLFFFKDFNKGVRQNFKANFVFFLIYAILIYFSLLAINNINSQNFLIYIPLAMVQAIFFPMLLVNVETTSIYSWRLRDSFRNSALIYVRNFLIVFLFSAILTLSLLFHFIPYIFLKYILISSFVLLVYPFVILAMRVCLNRCLDRDINKEHYPEIYKRGIYENQNDEYFEKVVTQFYGPLSTPKTIKNDPYLDIYYYHLCSFLLETDLGKPLIDLNENWPKEAMIDSLNHLRGLAYQRQLKWIKKDYSALGLMQKEKSKVAIVLAGGAYRDVRVLPEGLPVAVQLFNKGLTVFSFAYPTGSEAENSVSSLKSFLKTLLKNENRWNLDMEDYLIIGFGAGGHLASEMGTNNFGLAKEELPLPKLLGLCYPVITMGKETEIEARNNLLGENPSKEKEDGRCIELHVDKHYPNCFIWHCEKDDVVPYANSLLLVDSLTKADVDFRFEHFDIKLHGCGLANGTAVEGWVDRLWDYYLSLADKTNR